MFFALADPHLSLTCLCSCSCLKKIGDKHWAFFLPPYRYFPLKAATLVHYRSEPLRVVHLLNSWAKWAKKVTAEQNGPKNQGVIVATAALQERCWRCTPRVLKYLHAIIKMFLSAPKTPRACLKIPQYFSGGG